MGQTLDEMSADIVGEISNTGEQKMLEQVFGKQVSTETEDVTIEEILIRDYGFVNPVRNTPHAANTVKGLRNSAGYNVYTIINELVDNSIDAKSDTINVYFRGTKTDDKQKGEIIVSDNGSGMDQDTLLEALCVGSNGKKNKSVDFGTFGMGLNTASYACGDRLVVLTKLKDAGWIKAVSDVSTIVSIDDWFIDMRPLDLEDAKLIKEFLPDTDSGTIIHMSKLDIEYSPARVVNNSAKKIASVFWQSIDAGVNIKVNRKDIESYDPLEWKDWEIDKIGTTRIPSINKEIEVPFVDENRNSRTSMVTIKAISFPDPGSDPNYGNRLIPVSPRTSGIYVYRNGREIASGVSLNIYTPHSQWNSVRISISFNAKELDYAMGVNFNKTQIDADRIQDSVINALKPPISIFNDEVRRLFVHQHRDASSDDAKITNSKASKIIKEKQGSLILPDVVKPPTDNTTKGKGHTTKKGSKNRNLAEIKTSRKLGDVEFGVARYSKLGPIYSTYIEGDVMKVFWNEDHPLYLRIIQNPEMHELFNYTIHAMAVAEIEYTHGASSRSGGNTNPLEIVEKFKVLLSNNLKALLSD